MSDFFTATQRKLQHEFSSTALADRIVEAAVDNTLSDQHVEFIQTRNMFYLATIDETGFPSCSYKGGSVGFVRVLNANTIIFPDYNGNGMFMSMGNIEAQAKVGLLFVDYEHPQRLRLRGAARCLRDRSMLDSYPGANLVVEVTIEHAWVNCPRYVHRMQPLETSPYLPKKDGTATLALWKRIDLMQDVISEAERAQAQAMGVLTIEEYGAYVARGRLE